MTRMPGEADDHRMRSKQQRGPLGRAEEFERAMANIVAGRGVVLRGAPGAGRTTLAACVADVAARAGAAPLWIAPTPTLQQVPLGALAFLAAERAESRPLVDCLVEVVAAMRSHGDRALTVLVIDDAHFL